MEDLRAHGVKIAIVTSSNDLKMANVYKAHPELKELVDRIFHGRNVYSFETGSGLFSAGSGSL